MVFKLFIYTFPSFFLTYEIQPHISMYQVFDTFIIELILIEDFFLSLNSWHHAWPRFTSLKLHKWMKICLKNHPYIWHWCNIFMKKILNRERCTFILKLNPLELDIMAFFRTLTPWWFCSKSTPFLVMSLNFFANVFMKLKVLPLHMVFNFRHWPLSLVHGPICQLPHNDKLFYLVHTIRRILDFLQLWIITMAWPRTQHVIIALHWNYP